MPYLTLVHEDAPQCDYPLREAFNGVRWLVRAGASWRMMPHDLPPWSAVYQQTQRWLKAGVFESLALMRQYCATQGFPQSEESHTAIWRQSHIELVNTRWGREMTGADYDSDQKMWAQLNEDMAAGKPADESEAAAYVHDLFDRYPRKG